MGVKSAAGYEGSVSFNYSVTANGLISNASAVNFSVSIPLRPFISIWQVGSPEHGNGDNTITLPFVSGYGITLNALVDWGDGSPVTTVTSAAQATHTYAQPGEYTVKVNGSASHWRAINIDAGIRAKLIEVVDLGDLGWRDLSYGFFQCTKLKSFAGGETSSVTDMSSMFNGTLSLESIDLSSFDTSNVTSMTYMFSAAKAVVNLDLSNFNTAKVNYMTDMFSYTDKLTTLDISNFNTSSVYNMSSMFRSAVKLQALDVSSFDTSKVTKMDLMFQYLASLTTLDVSNFKTSNVNDMSYIFSGMSALTELNARGWDVSKATASSSVWLQTNPGVVLYCDQPSGLLFTKTCN